jgi:outer membrane protein, heavy metal efflux system
MFLAAAFLALPLGPVAAQPAGLTLDEAYGLARERSPMIAATRAMVDAVAARERSAALPPDPMIQVGAMNVGIPGLEADMASSMVPSIQIMQMVPIPGKLRLGGEIARQTSMIAEAGADETWWEVRTGTATAFYEIYRIDRTLEVMEETLGWLHEFEKAAAAMYGVGGGSQSDVLRAGVELGRVQADLSRERAMRTAAVARLNALLDRATETPVDRAELGDLPLAVPSPAVLARWADESRPTLARARTEVARASTREALARRELWPDLTIGIQYGQRPSSMGTERMGSVMVGFSVPIYARHRQLAMRSDAAAMEEMSKAELADLRARTGGEITALHAGLQRTATLLALIGDEVLPQAEANLTASFAAYRVGRVDFMTLLDALMSLNEYRTELHSLIAEYGVLVSELEMAIGRELPATGSLREVR